MTQNQPKVLRANPVRFWTLVSAASTIPITISILIKGDLQALPLTLMQGGGIAIMGIGAWWLARLGLSRITLWGALILLLLAASVQLTALNRFPFPNLSSASLDEIIEFEANGYQTIRRSVERTWEGSRASESPILLSFEARLLEGFGEGSWRPSVPDVTVVRYKDSTGRTVSRLTFPEGSNDPYVRQTYVSNRPLAGRVFRFSLSLRADNAVPEMGCRGIRMQIWGDNGASRCFPLAVYETWQEVSATWLVPETVIGDNLQLIINDFDGNIIEASGSRLEEFVNDSWVEVGPLMFGGASGSLSWSGSSHEDLGTQSFRLEHSWHMYEVLLEPKTKEHGIAQLNLNLTNGDVAAVRNLRLAGLSEGPFWGNARRLTLLTHHANQGGHAATSIGGALLSLTSSIGGTLVASLITTLLVLMTQSRTALLVLLAVLLLLLSYSSRRRLVLAICAVSIGIVLLLLIADFLGLSRVLSLANEGHGRFEVWTVAVQEFIRYPFTGSPHPISTYFTGVHPVNHAHNYLLELAYNHGLFGLLSGISLLTLISWRAFASGNIKIGATSLVMLTLQVADSTLSDLRILGPLLIMIESYNFQMWKHSKISISGSAIRQSSVWSAKPD